jgi:DsbC/DsbD-like thiol-disulfide interchange protein
MTRVRIAITCLLPLLVAAACSKPATNSAGGSATTSEAPSPVGRVTSESVVVVAAQPVEIPGGGSRETVVKISIKAGYHVNANPPTFSYLKPTELDITASDGISAASVSYPSPLSRKFAFADKPLAVYEGETGIKATIKADKAAGKGEHSIAARLRVQACDDQVCYPPGQIELRIPVTIK